jgi:hypothetical protein
MEPVTPNNPDNATANTTPPRANQPPRATPASRTRIKQNSKSSSKATKKGTASRKRASTHIAARSIDEALVESEGSHYHLNGPVSMNTYTNYMKLARVLGLDTKEAVKE